jgi:hypothetical protein
MNARLARRRGTWADTARRSRSDLQHPIVDPRPGAAHRDGSSLRQHLPPSGNVQASEVTMGIRHGHLGSQGVGDIESDWADAIAEVRDEIVELLRLAVAGCNPAPGFESRSGQGAAEAS